MTTQTQLLKLIFRGRLNFGTERTYNMVLQHWQTRVDNYFKGDVLFSAEQVFNAEDFSMTVPSQTLMSTEKHWRSTTSLLQEIAQYAIMGNVGAWCVDSGQVLAEFKIEPHSDKVAVSEYHRACALMQQGGMESEATEALNRAISRYASHALAYERRGYMNYKLKNFNDALYDFSKSIDLYPNNPEPYYGRGKVRMLKNEWESAVQDFNNCVRLSIPLQPIYWLARLQKGDSLFHGKKCPEATVELKAFLLRKFKEDDPNFRHRGKAEYLLVECEKSTGSKK
ncbi:MAG: tetratricopeptide repeat protein [Saprospiraceae bacterium]